MKKIVFGMLLLAGLMSCNSEKTQEKQAEKKPDQEKPVKEDAAKEGVIELASFKGQQVTGVTVSDQGQVFVNFPRWRPGVETAVAEVVDAGQAMPYPDQRWNSWEIGDPLQDSVFVAVQSVVAFENELFVLDTRNPQFKGVLDQPRVFVFDLTSNKLKKVYAFGEGGYFSDSYINDLRVDKKNGKVYFTDSGHAGLAILDLVSGEVRRVLNDHSSTLAEQDHLTINGKAWTNTVHSDGIALDTKNDKLYYHSLTGYNLYALPTDVLLNGSEEEVQAAVELVAKTPAPDGMIFDDNGNLYLADLENHKIDVLDAKGELSVLVEGDQIKWADTFSIHDGYLYFTNSRIHESMGEVSELVYSVNKIRLKG